MRPLSVSLALCGKASLFPGSSIGRSSPTAKLSVVSCSGSAPTRQTPAQRGQGRGATAQPGQVQKASQSSEARTSALDYLQHSSDEPSSEPEGPGSGAGADAGNQKPSRVPADVLLQVKTDLDSGLSPTAVGVVLSGMWLGNAKEVLIEGPMDSGSLAVFSRMASERGFAVEGSPPKLTLTLVDAAKAAPIGPGPLRLALPMTMDAANLLELLERGPCLVKGQEAVLRVDQSVEGAKQGLEAAAAANGLTLKLYYKKFLVISTEPLPEYRADLDPSIHDTLIPFKMSPTALAAAKGDALPAAADDERADLFNDEVGTSVTDATEAGGSIGSVHNAGERTGSSTASTDAASEDTVTEDGDAASGEQVELLPSEGWDRPLADIAWQRPGSASRGKGWYEGKEAELAQAELDQERYDELLALSWWGNEDGAAWESSSGGGSSPFSSAAAAKRALGLRGAATSSEEEDEGVGAVATTGAEIMSARAALEQRRKRLAERAARSPGVVERARRKLGQQLLRDARGRQRTRQYRRMHSDREALPIAAHKEEILRAVREHQVVIISGETGSGKSTQVPQFLLEEAIAAGKGGEAAVVVTQPRRISAVSLAQRVAQERCESLGDVVGFKVRIDAALSARTRLTFCTAGVLLRRLLVDPLVEDVSHIILDEVHERHTGTDFLMIALKELLAKRPGLKVILMSATLDAKRFADYFGTACPLVAVKGRTFPVEERYLEDLVQESGYVIHNDRAHVRAMRRLVKKQREAAEEGAGLALPERPRGLLSGPAVTPPSSAGDEASDSAQKAGASAPDVKDLPWHKGYSLDPKDFAAYRPRVAHSLANWLSHKQDKVDPFLVAAAVRHLHANLPAEENGAVLVILPGWEDILSVHTLLTCGPDEWLRLSKTKWLPRKAEGGQPEGSNDGGCDGGASPGPAVSNSKKGVAEGPQQGAQRGGSGSIGEARTLWLPHKDKAEVASSNISASSGLQDRSLGAAKAGSITAGLLPRPVMPSARKAILSKPTRPSGAAQPQGSSSYAEGSTSSFDERGEPGEGPKPSAAPGTRGSLPPAKVIEGMWVQACHSALSLAEQQMVFGPPPPGARKVVLATNIAETSITIPDVVAVVDGGRCKQRTYDPLNKLSVLSLTWVSRASAEQRKGRAGRVKPGVCYRLYPRPFFQQCFPAHDVPELQRTPLEELVLQILSLGLGDPPEFLARAMDPPEPRVVRNALELLQGPSETQWELTPLGYCLAQLPLHPAQGKLLIMATLLGVLDPVLTIAASESGRSPFMRAGQTEAEVIAKSRSRLAQAQGAGDPVSDHIAVAMAYQAYQKARAADAWELGRRSRRGAWTFRGRVAESDLVGQLSYECHLDVKALQDLRKIRTQLAELLADTGLLQPPSWLVRTPWEQLEQALAPAGFEPMASKPFSDKPWGSSWKAWGPPKGWTGGYMDSRGASSGMGAPPDQDIAGAEKLQLLQEWEEYGASFGVGGSWGEYLDGWGAGARGSNRDWVSAAQQRMWGEVAVWRRQHDRWLQYQRQQRPEAEQGRRSLLSLEEGEEGTMPPQAEPPGRGVGSGPGESAGSEPAMVTVPPPMRGQVLEWAVQEASCNAGDVEMLRAALVAGLYPNLAKVDLLQGKGAVTQRKRSVLTGQAKTKKEKTKGKGANKGEASKTKKRYRIQIRTLQDGGVSPGGSSLAQLAYQSVNDPSPSLPWLPHRWLVYSSKLRAGDSGSVFLSEVTPATDSALLLFAGDAKPGEPVPPSDDDYAAVGTVLALRDGLLQFVMSAEEANALMGLRAELEQLLQTRFKAPWADLSAATAKLLGRVRTVLKEGSQPTFIQAVVDD